MKQRKPQIYLASQSPRRQELLRQIGVDFKLLLLRGRIPRGPDVSEIVQQGESPAEYVARVTLEKAAFANQALALRKLPPKTILAADTTVVFDGKILGKPATPIEAAKMIGTLSGQTHQVLTSVAIRQGDAILQTTQCSEVTFDTLSDQIIQAYCATSEPYDKAGGYAVQGLAAQFIRNISGSYSGIMGLPLYETTQLLHQAGLQLL